MSLALAPVLLAASAMVGLNAAAQDFVLPGLFDVTGVAPGGALNVREAPDNRADVVGLLRAGATGVEVVALDPTGFWGQVNSGARSGWAALSHLTAQAGVWTSGGAPARLLCLGAEPAWSLRLEDGAATLAAPDMPAAVLAVTAILADGASDAPSRELLAETADLRLTGLISPAACADGTTERAYALSIDVVVEAGGGPALLRGCCTIAP